MTACMHVSVHCTLLQMALCRFFKTFNVFAKMWAASNDKLHNVRVLSERASFSAHSPSDLDCHTRVSFLCAAGSGREEEESKAREAGGVQERRCRCQEEATRSHDGQRVRRLLLHARPASKKRCSKAKLIQKRDYMNIRRGMAKQPENFMAAMMSEMKTGKGFQNGRR